MLKHFTEMTKFVLVRDEDISGVSGTGIVAEGIEYSNGSVAITWLTPYRCFASYESMKALEHVHSHGGRTRVVTENDEKEEK